MGKSDLSLQFGKLINLIKFLKLINLYKGIGYNIDIMLQTACLVVNPITPDSYFVPL